MHFFAVNAKRRYKFYQSIFIFIFISLQKNWKRQLSLIYNVIDWLVLPHRKRFCDEEKSNHASIEQKWK